MVVNILKSIMKPINEKAKLLESLEKWLKEEQELVSEHEPMQDLLDQKLCLAVLMNPIEVVEWLVEKGANYDAAPLYALTARQLALVHDRKDVVAYFKGLDNQQVASLQKSKPKSKS